MHVQILIKNNKMVEAITLFDSLPDVKFSSISLKNTCDRTAILCQFGRTEEALFLNKQCFEYIYSKYCVDDDDLFFMSIVGDTFLDLDDVEHAHLCVEHIVKWLQKLGFEDGNLLLCYTFIASK